MRWFAIIAFAAVFAFVACGGDNDREQAISQTVEGFYLAMAEDPPKAYTYLSQECKDRVSFFQFAAGLSVIDGIFGDAEPEVTELEIVARDGDELQAEFEVVIRSDGEEIPLALGLGDQGPTRFVKEDGRWRLDECAIFGSGDEFGEAPPPEPTDTNPVLVAAQAAEADASSALPGEFIDLATIYRGPYPDTASHIRSVIDYAADQDGLPPAGGPHWGSNPCGIDPTEAPPFCGPVPGGIYVEPWPAGSLLHNMEHGATIIWYNTDDQEIIDDLADFGSENGASNPFLVVTPFPDMEEETVAITMWSRRLVTSTADYDRDLLQDFFDKNNCRFDPEGFC